MFVVGNELKAAASAAFCLTLNEECIHNEFIKWLREESQDSESTDAKEEASRT
jgi:hypothetical protein